MGNFSTRIFDLFKFNVNAQQRILLLGLDSAGKTTILYHMKLNDTFHTIPTIGFNCEEIKMPSSNINFIVWDVGGQEQLRPLWKHYFVNCGGVLYVVDSSDRARFQEAASELHGMLNSSDMSNVPFVVLANKQDMPSAANATELIDRLNLVKLKEAGHDWMIEETVATRGLGLVEAFEDMAKLSKEFAKNYKR